jgi:hypothetical protein
VRSRLGLLFDLSPRAVESLDRRSRLFTASRFVLIFQLCKSEDAIYVPSWKLDITNKDNFSTDRNISGEIPHRVDTRGQWVERVSEGKAPIVMKHRPVIHLLTGENKTINISQVKNQQTLYGKQQMIEVDLTVHTIGEDNIRQLVRADSR